jgi:hypothetical protein
MRAACVSRLKCARPPLGGFALLGVLQHTAHFIVVLKHTLQNCETARGDRARRFALSTCFKLRLHLNSDLGGPKFS